MSEVNVAPTGGGAPSAAPSTPAPAQQEVQINQNPVNAPNPVGSQAPDAPPQAPSRSDSAKEAVQKAFERAQNPPPKGLKPAQQPAVKAAEATKGHNQPPEETPDDKPAKFDLKKKPVDEPQPRDRGRFAPRAQGEDTGAQHNTALSQASPGQPAAQPGQAEYKKLPSHAPFPEPPGRIAEHARRDWADTPETVRGEVHRMNHEFGKAVQHYRGAAEAFQPIARFHQMAQQHGTTLEAALTNYTGMEAKLRADPVAGLDVIVNNLGLKAPDGRPINLRDIAYHVLSQSPDQLRQLQQGNQQQAASQQIGALHQEISGLKQTLNQMHTQQRFVQTRSAVDQFATDHPRFDELGGLIEQELKLGFDLETAYRRAERLQPAAHVAQTHTPSAQTRPIDRSISGSPDVAPSNGASRRPKAPSPTARDAVQNALSRLNGTH